MKLRVCKFTENLLRQGMYIVVRIIYGYCSINDGTNIKYFA